MGTLAHPTCGLPNHDRYEPVTKPKQIIRLRQYASAAAAQRFCEKHHTEALRNSGRFVVNEIDGGLHEVELLVPADMREINLTWLFD